MAIRNLTPHTVRLNDGQEFPSVGVARVAASFSDFDVDGCCRQVFGDVTGLPAPEAGTLFVVSGLVLSALAGSRTDVVAPATGHPDVVRNADKQIVSVPGWVR